MIIPDATCLFVSLGSLPTWPGRGVMILALLIRQFPFPSISACYAETDVSIATVPLQRPRTAWAAFAHAGVRPSWEGKPADCRALDPENLARPTSYRRRTSGHAHWRLGESFSIHGAGRHWGRSRTTLLGRPKRPGALQACKPSSSNFTTCLFRTAPKHGRGSWWRRRSMLWQIWFPIAGTAMWNATSSR